ncbi:unnamed protein product [Moneuplotes crassus]|uniref:NADP-dependent malic enzyme n=1 Tax=Euplotes crassus TaxID=5936 RepID=A0AAD1UQ21_EUPCR|nr:unnamed protein product [Moneuplotes crassus]
MEKLENENEFKQACLDYHKGLVHGKYEVIPNKPMDGQKDLSLAYSPGVAYPCLEIEKDPSTSFYLTNRANSVGLFTNGTSVLGYGDIGVLAAKPVMEGKVVIMKLLGDLDSLDIGVDTKDPDEFVNALALLEPSFGAFNLEDIKGPECFYIEEELQKRVGIPVMHSGQHSSSCVITAALINACEVNGKKLEDLKIAVSGAGASGISIAKLLPEFGVKQEHILVCDSKGVIYKGREENMNKYKESIAVETEARTLEQIVDGADAFIGLSFANLLTPEMLKTMAKDPIVFALANPTPEIDPALARETREDIIIATGRSDYPNQILDAMIFPFFFRGALDVGAKSFNLEMKKAAVQAVAKVARMEVPQQVKDAYSNQDMEFGKDYILPTPFDHRLLMEVSFAVAKAAHDSGNTFKPFEDWDHYKEKLDKRVEEKRVYIEEQVEEAKLRYKNIYKQIRPDATEITQ